MLHVLVSDLHSGVNVRNLKSSEVC